MFLNKQIPSRPEDCNKWLTIFFTLYNYTDRILTSVSTVTRLRVDDFRIWVSLSAGTWDFAIPQGNLGSTQPPLPNAHGGISPGVRKLSLREAENSPPSCSPDAMNAAHHDSSILLRGVVLKCMHSHNFYLSTRNHRKYTKHHVHDLNPHQIHTHKRAGMRPRGRIRWIHSAYGRMTDPCRFCNTSFLVQGVGNFLTVYPVIKTISLWFYGAGISVGYNLGYRFPELQNVPYVKHRRVLTNISCQQLWNTH